MEVVKERIFLNGSSQMGGVSLSIMVTCVFLKTIEDNFHLLPSDYSHLFKFIMLTNCLGSFIKIIAWYLHSNCILVFCGARTSCMYKKELGQTHVNMYRREFGPHHTYSRGFDMHMFIYS